ncbi:MAG TPA: ABC transporter ATP-binding protein [Limnochordales bacterium]|nr:ABC transporter ATP-binding protein [Limnochordales bacterium]
MLVINQLESGYGEVPVLRGVSLTVHQGELVSLVGPNGAGKTTLLRTVSGLIKPWRGSITFLGQRIDGREAPDVCRLGLIQVPEGRALFPNMTVQENLEMGAYLPGARRALRESMDLVFQRFPILKQRRRQYAGTLSGGEQQMLAIGRGLMARPKMLMLDEPTLGVAPRLAQEILLELHRLAQEGLTLLLVTQEVAQSLRLAQRAYILENGRIVLQGRGPELLANPQVAGAYLGMGANPGA